MKTLSVTLAVACLMIARAGEGGDLRRGRSPRRL